jgi:hypothetical protein
MGTTVAPPVRKGRDPDDEVKLGDLLSGRLVEVDVDSVGVIRELREDESDDE